MAMQGKAYLSRAEQGKSGGILKAKPLHEDVLTLAKRRIAITAEQHDHLYVSFSGGKDSTAVLNITLDVLHENPHLADRHLPLRVVFADEECIPNETVDYVRRTAQRDDIRLEWYCLPFTMRNACSRKHPEWWTWAPEDRERWARPLPPEAITELDGFPIWPRDKRLSFPQTGPLLAPPTLGNVAVLMGIRAAESLTRRRAVSFDSKQREYNWLIPVGGNLSKSYPIYDWRTEDVWTAPNLLGWDYNRAYDLLAMLGIKPHDQRCSPAFGEEPIRGLHQFSQAFPDVWVKMAERVPGVGAALRYARTELYGFGDRPERPTDMTWQEFILHYLDTHPPEIRRQVAVRIRQFIQVHYRKTSDPILPSAPHPVSGMSWDLALQVAMRGDFKGRKNPGMKARSEPEMIRKMWHAYVAELSTIIDQGDYASLGHPRRQPRDPAALVPLEYRS